MRKLFLLTLLVSLLVSGVEASTLVGTIRNSGSPTNSLSTLTVVPSARITMQLQGCATQPYNADGTKATLSYSFTANASGGLSAVFTDSSTISCDGVASPYYEVTAALASGRVLWIANYRGNGDIILGTTAQLTTLNSQAFGMFNPMLAAGDLIYGGLGGKPTRLAAGTSGYCVGSNGSALGWMPCGPGTGGSGTVTSVGLTPPASDFTAGGSVTTFGNLTFNWTVPPTSANTASAIVKRDASGNFTANTITADVTGNAQATLNTLNAHVSATQAHGTSSAIVGINDTQTLKNKTLDNSNRFDDLITRGPWRDARAYATGGNGTSTTPWIGWEGAITGASAGQEVRFPAGYYSTATGVTFTQDSIIIKGSGTRQTFITATAAMAYVLGTDGTSRHHSIQNLTIDANHLATNGLLSFKGTNLDLPTAENIVVQNAVGTGAIFRECQVCVLRGITSQLNGGGGFSFEGDNASLVTGITSIFNTGVGVTVKKYVDGATTFSGGMNFYSVDVESNGSHAVQVVDTQANVGFWGGHLESSTDLMDGFRISAPNVQVHGVRMSGCSSVAGTAAGFNLLAGAENADVANNSVGNGASCGSNWQTPIIDASIVNGVFGPLTNNSSGVQSTGAYRGVGAVNRVAYGVRDEKTGVYSANVNEVDLAGGGTQLGYFNGGKLFIHKSSSYGFPSSGIPVFGYIDDTTTGISHSAAGTQCLVSSGTCRVQTSSTGTSFNNGNASIDTNGKATLADIVTKGPWIDSRAYASIQAALDASSAGQKVVVTASSTVTSNITVTGKTLECLPGVTLTKGYSGTLVTLTGDKSALLNCTIDGAQVSGWTGSNVILNGATNAAVEGNTILNSASYGIYLVSGANKNKIRKNTVTGGLSIAIFGEKNADDNEVSDNFVSTAGANSGSHAIAFHGSLAANTVNREKITGNRIEQGAAVGFCVEVGDFGGLTSDGDTITSNKCILVGTAAGGYSLSGATKAAVGNNTFDVNGQSATVAALEMVVTTYSTATGNVLNGGTTAAKGMTLDRSSNNTVIGNVLNGWSTASGAQGLHIVSNTAGVSAGANVVSGNQFIFPTGGVLTRGVMVQSNNATSDANFNQIVSNDFVGNGATSSNGVLLEKDAGSVAYTTVGLNKFSAIDVAINQASDDNTTRVGNTYGTGVNTVTGGSGTNSRAFDSNSVRTSNGGSLSAGTGSAVVINSLQIGTTSAVVASTDQNGKGTFNGGVVGGINSLTFSSTPVFDFSKGNLQKITLTANATSSTLSNASAGQHLEFLICQDATGSRTFVWPTNVKGGAVIGSTASTCSVQLFVFDGTNAYAVGPAIINQ